MRVSPGGRYPAKIWLKEAAWTDGVGAYSTEYPMRTRDECFSGVDSTVASG